jgi:hypothetical protein
MKIIRTPRTLLNRKKQVDTRIQATRVLVTIDQIGTGVDKKEAFNLEDLKTKLQAGFDGKIVYACIGREKHKDKGWHVHIFIHFKERIRFTYANNPFYYLYEKPANVQVVKPTREDESRTLTYVRKSQDYIEIGETSIVTNKILKTNASSKTYKKLEKISEIKAYIAKMIREGITLEGLIDHEVDEVKNFVLFHPQTISRAIYEIENLKKKKEMDKLMGIEKINLSKIRNKKERQIAKILNDAKNMRPHKSINLHIWSAFPGMGKTSLVNKIQEYSSCYRFPPDTWFTRYINYSYTFIIWDEVSFEGLKPTFLNMFLEGTKCQMPVKGDLTHKEDNPLVIMLSNMPIREHLEKISNPKIRETFERTLLARVHEVELDRPIFNLLKHIKPKVIDK